MIAAGCVAPAFAENGSLDFAAGSIEYSIFAPEWIWQGRHINILMVFENELAGSATITARLGSPAFNAHAFRYDGPASRSLTLGPGGEGRLAFASILARDKVTVEAVRASSPGGDDSSPRTPRTEKVPTGHFVFPITLEAAAGDQTRTVQLTYPVQTVRGAAVGEGLAAMWLPVALILGWCAVVFLIVPRMAEPGAWRQTSGPFKDDADTSEEPTG